MKSVFPNRKKKLLYISFFCLLCFFSGFLALSNLKNVSLIIFLFGIFGGGAFFAFRYALKISSSIYVDNENLKLCFNSNFTIIKWIDIDDIGIFSTGKMIFVGLKLKNYNNILNINEQTAKILIDNIFCFYWTKHNTKLSNYNEYANLWNKLKNHKNIKEIIKKENHIGKIFEQLCWNRKNTNYDISFSYSEINGTPKQFVKFLKKYL